ncbi:hypothetical protein GGI04_002611 [Coemansia thaxteri]|nr:hypothetical protein GGI04_002611 [Coemansia thaxteri]
MQLQLVRFSEFLVPVLRAAVNDHVVPFYVNTLQPRWNNQIKPAVSRYSKIAWHYTRSSVLPAIADGASHTYRLSRHFATTYLVPHAKRATIHVYAFSRLHIVPPIRRVYAQTLKEHVDRVVPWDIVNSFTDKSVQVSRSILVFAKDFTEEFYFMCYAIVTGDEHPSVVARLKKAQEDTARSASAKNKEDTPTAVVGHLHGFARKLSGSARQWIQVAKGWAAPAATLADDVVATIKSQTYATASAQQSQATPSAAAATSKLRSSSEIGLSASGTSTMDSLVATLTVVETVVETAVLAKPSSSETASVEGPVLPTASPAIVKNTPDFTVAPIDAKDIAWHPAVNVASFATIPGTGTTIRSIGDLADSVATPVAKSKDSIASDVTATEARVFVDTNPAVNVSEAEVAQTPLEDMPVSADDVVEESFKAEEQAPRAQSVTLDDEIQLEEGETSVPAAVVDQTTTPDAVPFLVAEDAASLVYEVRDSMAGVVADDNDRAVFDELLQSAAEAARDADKLEQFPVVVNDIDDSTSASVVVAEPDDAPAPLAPQTTMPEDSASSAESNTPALVIETLAAEGDAAVSVGIVDENVRKAASNWVKDARESISKELAQERTRSGHSSGSSSQLDDVAPEVIAPSSLPLPSQPSALEPADQQPPLDPATASVAAPVTTSTPYEAPAVPEADVASAASVDLSGEQKPIKRVPREPTAAKPIVKPVVKPVVNAPAPDIVNAPEPPPVVKPVVNAPAPDIVNAPEPPVAVDLPPLASVVEPDVPTVSTEEKTNTPAKRLKKPIADGGDASAAKSGPRKIKKTKKRVVKKSL